MKRKYIKVTEKGRPSCIVLAANEQFYKQRGAQIEEATQEEIEKYFPEEALKSGSKSAGAQSPDTVKAALEAEKVAHKETKKSLKDANECCANLRLDFDDSLEKLKAAKVEFDTLNVELEKAKNELDELKKKTKKADPE